LGRSKTGRWSSNLLLPTERYKKKITFNGVKHAKNDGEMSEL
jgi:hypothetical protein